MAYHDDKCEGFCAGVRRLPEDLASRSKSLYALEYREEGWGIHFVGSLTRGARLLGAVVTATEY